MGKFLFPLENGAYDINNSERVIASKWVHYCTYFRKGFTIKLKEVFFIVENIV